MRSVVWVSGWQFECCGEPFAVGDRVGWTVSSAVDRAWLRAALGADTAASVTHHEDHHEVEADAVPVEGVVRSITSAACLFGPASRDRNGPLHPLAGTETLRTVESSAGHEPPSDGSTFIGFVVALDVDEA